MNALRILSGTMNYLDRRYCRGSILEWIRSTPEGSAYVIVRRLFAELLEESNQGERACVPTAEIEAGNARSVAYNLRLTGSELPTSASATRTRSGTGEDSVGGGAAPA